jgi:hypothetical protein
MLPQSKVHSVQVHPYALKDARKGGTDIPQEEKTFSIPPPSPANAEWEVKSENASSSKLELPTALGYDKLPGVMRMPVLNQSVTTRLATVVSMSCNGSGFVNSTLAVNAVSLTPDFTGFASLFREFFVVSMVATWQPNSRYNAPIGFVNTTLTQAANLPIAVVQLQHGSAAYTTIALAAASPTLKFCNTGDPFVYAWKNMEKASVGTVVYPIPATVTPTQSWCLSDSTSSTGYSGSIQFISPSAGPALPISAVLGQFVVVYDVKFRNRL